MKNLLNALFKRDPLEIYKQQNKKIAFFKNGMLFDVYPRNRNLNLYDDRQTAYEAQILVNDGNIFNLEDVDSIKSIPTFQIGDWWNAVFRLDYILKIHIRAIDDIELLKVTAQKLVEFMQAQKGGWLLKDYLSVAYALMKKGEFENADHIYLEGQKAEQAYREWLRQNTLDMLLKNELVYADNHNATCEICSKYQNRVYSTTGKDKRFPVLPKEVFIYGGFHKGCRHSFFPFFYYDGCKLDEHYYDKKSGICNTIEYDAIIHSNRPFVDSRTEDEKRVYENMKRDVIPVDYEYRKMREKYIVRFRNLQEYNSVVSVMGEKAPKTFSGYMRMKNSNSKNYQTIVKKMKENGSYDF